jgi:hypothetical protein
MESGMPARANQRSCRRYRRFLRTASAARVGIFTLVVGLAMALSADSARAQVYPSAMTRPVGSDGLSASPADNSPAPQPDSLGDASAATTQPPAPQTPTTEMLPNAWQPNGPIQIGPIQPDGGPDGGMAPQGIDPSGAPPPPGSLSPDQSSDFDSPPRHHPVLDGFRRMFGPEPNGNWDNEPVHFDTFLGFIDDRTAENTGVLGGFRLGWDYDTYWGVETRLAFTSLQEDTGPVVIWDESLLYYPWGDSRVRPYITLGLGISEFKIVDVDDLHHRENLVDMPFGFGFKYRLHEWLVLRFDVLDNLAFGSGGLGTMNNFSFTTGFEYRFGGAHVNYWPWNPAPAR